MTGKPLTNHSMIVISNNQTELNSWKGVFCCFLHSLNGGLFDISCTVLAQQSGGVPIYRSSKVGGKGSAIFKALKSEK